MTDEEKRYLKNRYKRGNINYIIMLMVATVFASLGIYACALLAVDFSVGALVGLIFILPLLGFGFGFGYYAINKISIRIKSVRLIDKGKAGSGKIVRIKTVGINGKAHIMHSIVFTFINDNGKEVRCATDYVFYPDERRKLYTNKVISIKYCNSFAVVLDVMETFQQASANIKEQGKEFMNNDRSLGTASKQLNKFLGVYKIGTIVQLLILVGLVILSFVTGKMVLFYIGIIQLFAGAIVLGIIFAVLYFGKSN